MPPKKRAAADPADGTDSSAPPAKRTSRKKRDVTPHLDTVAPANSKAQFVKTPNFTVPVDEACPSKNYKVYIDSSTGIIYDASLNQSNSQDNNNKFYRLQLLVDEPRNIFLTWSRWGRVGNTGQSTWLGDGSFQNAMIHFEKKFKEKSGLGWEDRLAVPKPKKYTFIERDYVLDEDVAPDEALKINKKVKEETNDREPSPPKCTLSAPVRSAMELIFNADYLAATMADLNYDANKLPLGKLSRTTITRGYEALKALSEVIDDPTKVEAGQTFQSTTQAYSNAYFSLIPHAFGRSRPPVINEVGRLRKEIELLDSLTDMKIADSLNISKKKNVDSIHILDSKFNALNISMDPVERDSKEFANISAYLNESRGATHGLTYDLVDVFCIDRSDEADRFAEFSQTRKGKSRRLLLFHGSSAMNFGGILSQGLRIAPPEAPVSGYMFGKGIYLADASSKSANYCRHHTTGGNALLMLIEAEVGNPTHDLTGASYTAGEEAAEKGCIATFGQGLTGPKKWKDCEDIHPSLKGVQYPDTTTMGPTNIKNAFLQYNEYIAYSVEQVKIRYLLRVKM